MFGSASSDEKPKGHFDSRPSVAAGRAQKSDLEACIKKEIVADSFQATLLLRLQELLPLSRTSTFLVMQSYLGMSAKFGPA
jgi:hypothetical protein